MHLLLVEDDHLVAQGLCRSLRQEGYSVEHSATVKHALQCLGSGEIELVILDLGLPDGDGSQILKHIKAQKKVIPVVILTARSSIDDKVQGLDMGADDYLAKPFEPAELFARLRVASRRVNQAQSSLLQCGDVTMDTSAHSVTLNDELLSLPRKEYMLLKALLENQGRVQSKQQLENKLYQWGEEVGSNTIEVHIHHLRKKFPSDFIKTLRGIGYVVGKR
ncbi:MAG: DNA-binding response OmpR family regulator [Pseudoalteromonas tetraodonis]|jgi:DNA-binding response OmpR family regulator|uniref:Transcriptional regulatory protein QseB n=5 Tax=Pseudoalteromonas TaxID=53246 RepID=A0A9W4QZ40_PSEHA|nr:MULTISPECIES: response regulator transcription factor [Pseudoalteromonas]ADT70115.1 response regulator [Pseudoalteromonas sp. SM9913]ALQ56369.1 Response regulator [Pseudoalteromonas issachenkonii]ATC92291.1 two-component system, OmpR family, response regulator [Pseudoalteromonas issachenkonii]ATD04824.1 two-component system, OmpR family, response regulator [Pseudoalteromonas tetraodonis]EWS96407.1 XRE family transcriptional regulator [Pseudoalteromonas sp. SCSIO_11900]|tara:strand:+ start:751 stop:1410 length:660 start_codon:yes stop_codon:yes gene_type:complete